MITSTSINGLNFIKQNEGFRADVYNDNGKPAIGYGHDLKPGESFPNGITRGQADDLLAADIRPVDHVLSRLADPSCTQNQWDALSDFAYNLGIGDLETLLGHGWSQVPSQIPRWCYEKEPVSGIMVKSEELLARRMKEVALFQA